jgi:glycosyltransferase involved in cell wall biosynthesis
MADSLKVTVVVPAHKSGSCIEKCIRSLCAQDYPKTLYKIIVVDDSDDAETKRVCDEFGAQYYYEKDTSSAGKARNFALDRINTEVVAFIDSDCVAPPNWLSQIVDALSSNPDVAGVVGAYGEGRNWIERLANNEHMPTYRVKLFPTGILEGNCGFKMSELDGLRFGEHKYEEGMVLADRLSARKKKLLVDYSIRVAHNGFTYTFRKAVRIGRAHYHNTRDYFHDVTRSDLFSIAVFSSTALALTSPFLGIVGLIPALIVFLIFVYFTSRVHQRLPKKDVVPAYLYFIGIRWTIWLGYFYELVAERFKNFGFRKR